MSNSGSSNREFNKGDKIEVLRNSYDGDATIWFPATVLESPSPDGFLLVKYDTLFLERDDRERRRRRKKMRGYVDMAEEPTRLVPPAELHRCFAIGEEVEVFHERGWWSGEVKDVLQDSTYRVAIGGTVEIMVEKRRVRVRRHWKQNDESLVPSPLVPQLEKSSQLDSQSKKRPKVRIRCGLRTSRTVTFDEGTLVEVKSNEEGHLGYWYTALIVELLGKGKFVVEYQTLKRSDGTGPLKEEVDASWIRPIPPGIERCDRFEELERVDAWYNEGWWVGIISEVFDQFQYLVYFSTTNKVMRFGHSNLRPHQEWIDLEWVISSDPEALKLQSRYGRRIPNFSEGTRVEVKSDDEGYHGSMFTATVVGSVGNGKLLVQFDTLTTDDEVQPLVETVFASNLRPLPRIISRLDRFKILEEVDAWYNDGWWVGLVSRVLPGLKYVVYFWTTNEEFEFAHSQLRPHQELINETWISSFLIPKLAAKSRLEKVKIQTAGRTSMAGFLRGLKVEIAHGERGCLSSLYPAIILGPFHNGKYRVEYRTLKTDNGCELVKEEVDALCIRPCPPIIQRADQFKLCDGVDAWDDNGWRLGQICRTVKGSKYVVYFRATNTMAKFQHTDLRPHQDFVDGAWFLPA